MDNSENTLSIENPDEFYDYYKNNEYFLDAFARVMLSARDTIKNDFKGVSVSIYGRIKSEDSFNAKVEQKIKNGSPNIFDVYAFKIIVNKVDRNYKSNNPDITTLQKSLLFLDKKRKEILDKPGDEDSDKKILASIDALVDEKEELLGDLVSMEISNYLTQNNSPLLNDTKATNMPERDKDYNKSNGFLSHQRTIKMYPDPNNPNACCFVEFQCRSLQADLIAKNNHEEFKIEKYGPDASSFPRESFDDCNSAEDFINLYGKAIPTYVYLNKNEVIKSPYFVNFIHFYADYLFEKEVDENGNIKRDSNGESIYVHQKDLDKLNELSKGFKRDSSYTMNLNQQNNESPGGGPEDGPSGGVSR